MSANISKKHTFMVHLFCKFFSSKISTNNEQMFMAKASVRMGGIRAKAIRSVVKTHCFTGVHRRQNCLGRHFIFFAPFALSEAHNQSDKGLRHSTVVEGLYHTKTLVLLHTIMVQKFSICFAVRSSPQNKNQQVL